MHDYWCPSTHVTTDSAGPCADGRAHLELDTKDIYVDDLEVGDGVYWNGETWEVDSIRHVGQGASHQYLVMLRVGKDMREVALPSWVPITVRFDGPIVQSMKAYVDGSDKPVVGAVNV